MDKQPNSKVNLDRAIQRIYGTGAKYIDVLPTCDEAVKWANELIARIDNA